MVGQKQVLFWLILFALLIAFFQLFASVLPPFIAAFVLSYLLHPMITRMEAWGLPRGLSAAILLLFAGLVAVVLVVTIFPIVIDQLSALITKMPIYIARLQQLVQKYAGNLLNTMGETDQVQTLRDQFVSHLDQGAKWFADMLTSLVSGGKTFVNIITLLVLTPILTLYLAVDWPRIIRLMDSWLPRAQYDNIRALLLEMDESIAGFFRGQALICLILACFYALALSLVGLHFGFALGLMIGLISFVPFLGVLLGFIISVALAFAQASPDWVLLISVMGVFGIGQILEGYVLQPKLLGRALGLHPVWLIFALLGAGVVMGFFGILIAVPSAAIIGVLVRFTVRVYLKSSFYLGSTPPLDEKGDQLGLAPRVEI